MSAKDYTWLIEGLVGLRHRDLYLHNAEFHAQINALNQMLPPMIDGLAKRAEEIGDRQEKSLQRLMLESPRFLVTADDVRKWEVT